MADVTRSTPRTRPAPSTDPAYELSLARTVRGGWVVRRWHVRDRAWAFVAGVYATKQQAEAAFRSLPKDNPCGPRNTEEGA